MTVEELIDILTTYLECEGNHEVVVYVDGAQYAITDCSMDGDGENVEISICPRNVIELPSQNNDQNIRLKPCPFCGEHEARIHYPYFSRKFCSVQCYGCFMTTALFDTPEKAVEAWNRRV